MDTSGVCPASLAWPRGQSRGTVSPRPRPLVRAVPTFKAVEQGWTGLTCPAFTTAEQESGA
ncbi:hypothetical protein LQK93_00980 [Terrabacter sp. BE26]